MEDVVQLTLYINTLADYFYFYEEGCDTVEILFFNSTVSVDFFSDCAGDRQPSSWENPWSVATTRSVPRGGPFEQHI